PFRYDQRVLRTSFRGPFVVSRCRATLSDRIVRLLDSQQPGPGVAGQRLGLGNAKSLGDVVLLHGLLEPARAVQDEAVVELDFRVRRREARRSADVVKGLLRVLQANGVKVAGGRKTAGAARSSCDV
ncbi:MAG: hypothetical protein BJ554DRAFT_1384, partial [Olpidium bornovanus]